MNIKRLFASAFSFFLILSCLAACGGDVTPTASAPQVFSPVQSSPAVPSPTPVPQETEDFAGSIKLDMSSDTAKQEVTVKSFVDGDTVHFHVPHDLVDSDVLKARFLAINTPESTGKIEEYGKKASEFTKEILSSAHAILIESETDHWDPDSTGSRYLVWVWYKKDANSSWRNLNIEILQNGLALANSTANNRYGTTAMAALNQAKEQKLNLYSGQRDPDFFYGEAVELTLRELRTNIDAYVGMKVAFNGVVTTNSGTQGVYVEEYDPETDLYYGIYLYYGHGLNGMGLDILSIGNEVRVVGTVQYYEAGGSYQISDLNYRMMKPDDPGNIQKLSDGHIPAYRLTDPSDFVNGEVTVDTEDQIITIPYTTMAMATSIEMQGLKVVDVYTTTDEDSSSYGAMTLTCEADGVTVTVRTSVLRDQDGQLITEDAYMGKTVNVRGVVDTFDGEAQIKVFSAKNITIIQ